MKKIKLYFQAMIIPIIIGVTFSSCNSFLDVDKELADELDEKQIFTNAPLYRKFHRTIMEATPNSAELFWDPSGTSNPWSGLSDEMKISWRHAQAVGGIVAKDNRHHRWGIYTHIRQANLFMEKAAPLPSRGPSDNEYIDEDEFKKMYAEAKFYRAYYHYLLLELYGAVPIMDKSVDHNQPDLNSFERASIDEVAEFIDKELTEIIDQTDGGLPTTNTDPYKLGMPSKAIAMAIRAKLWVIVSSPLLNGGYEEAMALTNKDGKRIFPDKDDSKWKKAVEALKAFIEFSKKHYKLFRVEDKEGNLLAEESFYKLFVTPTDNPEIIWANPRNAWGSSGSSGTGGNYDGRNTPKSVYKGYQSMGPTQSLVDAFYMTDGKTIKDSPIYKGYNGDPNVGGSFGFCSPGQDPSGQIKTETYNMWVQREPRFYATIFFHGRRWHMTSGTGDNSIIKFNKGHGNHPSDQNVGGDYSWTGYGLYKRLPRTTLNTSGTSSSHYRPQIIFRLAEFYLLYIEALNEVNPQDPNIKLYWNQIRERAGIPNIEVSYPEIIGNKELQRKMIQRESRIELATEGQRYFDVRRWMVADKGDDAQGGVVYGMNIDAEKNGEREFYKLRAIETRPWLKAYYLYPLPENDVINSSGKLVQNPGY